MNRPVPAKFPFGRELYIERSDFMEDAPKKFFRLTVGREVRLRYAYFLKCHEAIKDDEGNVVELRCTYDPETAGGKAPDGRKVKGTIHWVSAEHAVDAEVRLYDVLFEQEDPSDVPEGKDWKDLINPNALQSHHRCQAGTILGRQRKSAIVFSSNETVIFASTRRFAAWQAGFQSHGNPERRLGESQKK